MQLPLLEHWVKCDASLSRSLFSAIWNCHLLRHAVSLDLFWTFLWREEKRLQAKNGSSVPAGPVQSPSSSYDWLPVTERQEVRPGGFSQEFLGKELSSTGDRTSELLKGFRTSAGMCVIPLCTETARKRIGSSVSRVCRGRPPRTRGTLGKWGIQRKTCPRDVCQWTEQQKKSTVVTQMSLNWKIRLIFIALK